ncbi:MAG: hypothetical protein Kow0088_24660 [Anaerolineales bacterium]
MQRLYWRRIPLVWIENFVLFTIGIFYLAKFVFYLYFENPHENWMEIETIAAGMIILFVLSYIILESQFAFRLSLIYTATTLIIGLGKFYPTNIELLPDFIRLETRLIVIALLTFVLAKVKDELILAQRQAAYWEWQANIDHLTQLPNRRMISTLIEQSIKEHKIFSILLIDIDDFKCFNDTYGHDHGDVLLSRIAYALKTNLRATDVVSRWGGEEFLVLLYDTTPDHAYQLAERLRHEVLQMEFNEDRVSVSIGGTLFKLQDNLPTLLKRADNALYTAKAQGRNCVCWE